MPALTPGTVIAAALIWTKENDEAEGREKALSREAAAALEAVVGQEPRDDSYPQIVDRSNDRAQRASQPPSTG